MPPKKTASSSSSRSTKIKSAKKQDEGSQSEEEAVPEKRTRGAAKTFVAQKEKQVAETEKEKKGDTVDSNGDVPSEPEKKTKGAARKTKKKQQEENVIKHENNMEQKKKNKSKKEEEQIEEPPEASDKKPTTSTKAKRSKKNKESPDSEEQTSDEDLAPKRKAPKARTASENKKTPANSTLTNWEVVNFKCTSKNSSGKESNFHIISWNVDGLRAWLNKGGLNILKYGQPEILCLQETKCSLEKLPEEIKDVEGYETFWCSSDKDGYAGVGLLTKTKPLEINYGIGSEEHDTEGRCITAEYEQFYLINVYVPNAGRGLVTLPKRLEWNELFKDYVKKLDEKKPVIVCGDMNVAHTEIDLANPKTNKKNAGFTIEEREGMTDFLEDGYVDTFRSLYPDREKAYTFWTYMANARVKNVGWRLDYFLVSARFMENVCDNVILDKVLGSDHCPLALHVNI